MQTFQHLIDHIQRHLTGGAGSAGVCEGHSGTECLPAQAADGAQSAHAHGDDRRFRVMIRHLGGRGQQGDDIGPAGGHDGKLGQVSSGLLHGGHPGDELGAGRRFVEVVAGTDNFDPGGMSIFDQARKICARGEKFNVDQVSAVGGKDGMDETNVLLPTQRGASALALRAKGHKQKLVLQGDTQLRRIVRDGPEVFCKLEQIDAPFHTIGGKRGKLSGLLQDRSLSVFYDWDDDVRLPFADAAVSDGDAGHENPSL